MLCEPIKPVYMGKENLSVNNSTGIIRSCSRNRDYRLHKLGRAVAAWMATWSLNITFCIHEVLDDCSEAVSPVTFCRALVQAIDKDRRLDCGYYSMALT